MSNIPPDDPSIHTIQDLLDETARECLRCMSIHNLTSAQNQRLAKFIFGCMNQKHELPSRVDRHGAGELAKVLRFVAAAVHMLIAIGAEHQDRS